MTTMNRDRQALWDAYAAAGRAYSKAMCDYDDAHAEVIAGLGTFVAGTPAGTPAQRAYLEMRANDPAIRAARAAAEAASAALS